MNTPKERGLRLFAYLLPWFFALALLGFSLRKTSLHEALEALQRGGGWRFAAVIVLSVVLVLLGDVLGTVGTYLAAGLRLPWRTVAHGRLAACLPQVLSVHLGQAFLGYYLVRRCQLPVRRVVALALVGYGVVAGGLVLIALGSLPWSAARQPRELAWLAALLALGVGGLAVLAWRPRFAARLAFLDELMSMGSRGVLRALLWRTPQVLALLGSTWAAYWCFGVRLPWSQAAFALPLILLVASLPFTPQGLGTRELAALHLLRPFASASTGEADILTAGTSLALGAALCQLALGAIALPSALRTPPTSTPWRLA